MQFPGTGLRLPGKTKTSEKTSLSSNGSPQYRLDELELFADILATIFASMSEAEISAALTEDSINGHSRFKVVEGNQEGEPGSGGRRPNGS